MPRSSKVSRHHPYGPFAASNGTERRQVEADAPKASASPRSLQSRQRSDAPQAVTLLGSGPAFGRRAIAPYAAGNGPSSAGEFACDRLQPYAADRASPAQWQSHSEEPDQELSIDKELRELLAGSLAHDFPNTAPTTSSPLGALGDEGLSADAAPLAQWQPHAEGFDQELSIDEVLRELLASSVAHDVPNTTSTTSSPLGALGDEGLSADAAPLAQWQPHAEGFDLELSIDEELREILVGSVARDFPNTASTTSSPLGALGDEGLSADGAALAQRQSHAEDHDQTLSIEEVVDRLFADSAEQYAAPRTVTTYASASNTRESGSQMMGANAMGQAPIEPHNPTLQQGRGMRPRRFIDDAAKKEVVEFLLNNPRETLVNVQKLFPNFSLESIQNIEFDEKHGCNRTWTNLSPDEQQDAHREMNDGVSYGKIAAKFKLTYSSAKAAAANYKEEKLGRTGIAWLSAARRAELKAELMASNKPDYEALAEKYEVLRRAVRNFKYEIRRTNKGSGAT